MELDFTTTTTVLLILGTVTPFVTAVLTKLRDPDWWKGLVSLTSAAAIGLFAEIQNVGLDAVEAADVVRNGLLVWGVHLMAYFGVTKDMVSKFAQLPSVVKMALPGPGR